MRPNLTRWRGRASKSRRRLSFFERIAVNRRWSSAPMCFRKGAIWGRAFPKVSVIAQNPREKILFDQAGLLFACRGPSQSCRGQSNWPDTRWPRRFEEPETDTAGTEQAHRSACTTRGSVKPPRTWRNQPLRFENDLLVVRDRKQMTPHNGDRGVRAAGHAHRGDFKCRARKCPREIDQPARF